MICSSVATYVMPGYKPVPTTYSVPKVVFKYWIYPSENLVLGDIHFHLSEPYSGYKLCKRFTDLD